MRIAVVGAGIVGVTSAYELAADGALSATIGFLKGGTPRRFEFRREDR